MGIFVKICCIANEDDALRVAELRPDAVGFIFSAKSKRHVTASDVGRWTAQLPKDLLKVGVFVDTEPRLVASIMQEAGLDVAQLHGSEMPMAYAKLGLRVWKTAYAGRADASSLSASPIDAVLLDTYSPTSPGGTGEVGDWKAAADFVKSCTKHVLLAGGLSPENVREAIRAVRPWGVDVCSVVEASPGRKDLKKVEAFITACRRD